MSKFLAVPVVVLVALAWPATGLAKKPADRDRDGLPDRWEKRYDISTRAKSGKRDPDHDHLKNRREYKLRLNPRRRDTDHDGLWDRAELKKFKTNPRKADTDGDGYKDGTEVKAGTNPRKASSHPSGPPDAPGAARGTPAPAPAPAPPAAPPPAGGFPTPDTTGVPAGWVPKTVYNASVTIRTPGAVVEDVQIDNGDLMILAPNVTVRRVKLRGGRLLNASGPTCAGQGMVVEDSTIEPPPGALDPVREPYVIGEGGYTLRRVKVWRAGDGPRMSYRPEGCGPVTIENSFISVTQAGNQAWHTDGLQAYYGPHLNIRNVTIDARGDRYGTSAAFFYPNQFNDSATVDGLLLLGGAYSFRLGEPSTVRGLRIVDKSWLFGPLDVKCSVVSSWEASIVNIDANYQVTNTVRNQPCNTNGGD